MHSDSLSAVIIGHVLTTIDDRTPPAERPLRTLSRRDLDAGFVSALAAADGLLGAHCIHETWMRGACAHDVEALLGRLWAIAAPSIPDWLPMRHVSWLPILYDVARRFCATAGGRSHIYLILLDYADARPEPYGVYVGMSTYTPTQRFDQHKAGIRAAGSVLKRGLEVLAGPAWHLQYIKRRDAARIEIELAQALTEAGLFVKGGH